MAKLKNIEAFHTDTDGKLVTVGHSRQVMTSGNLTKCYLHGHNILRYNRETGAYVVMTRGYETVTTDAAIRDFFWRLRS